jgi:hypothetical protein
MLRLVESGVGKLHGTVPISSCLFFLLSHSLYLCSVFASDTYMKPLHRLREFGVPVRDYYSMDYAKFNLEQVRKLLAIM